MKNVLTLSFINFGWHAIPFTKCAIQLLLLCIFFVIIVIVVVNSIQETDGGYFEAFTSLAWKRDNRRMSAVRTAETRAEMLPEKEHDSQAYDEISETPDEKEQLYIEVLQTIANAVGAPAPGGQVCMCVFVCLIP